MSVCACAHDVIPHNGEQIYILQLTGVCVHDVVTTQMGICVCSLLENRKKHDLRMPSHTHIASH
jgi:hypothetical protein